VPLVVVAYLVAFARSAWDLSFEGRVFPQAFGALSALLVLSLVYSAVREFLVARKEHPGGSRPLAALWGDGRRNVYAIAATIGFAYAATQVGFFLALAPFLVVTLWLLGVAPWWRAMLVGVAYWGLIYTGFAVLLGMRLPTGG
jgi:hypothetical protein